MSEAVEKLVRKRDAAGIVSFFARMDEAERRGLAPAIIALAKVGGDSMLGDAKAPFAFDHDAQACANLAVAATATMAEMKTLGWRFSPPFWEPNRQDSWLAILRDRAPDWIDDWAEWLLQENHRAWRFVRRMERAGLCRPSDSDAYVLAMIEGLAPAREGGSLIDGLLEAPDLLEGPFWRLFEVEGGGEVSLANFEKFGGSGGNGWAHAMRELSARGELDRGRLLDASLETLARDFSQYRAGWFSRFHEYMEPTVEDRAARTDRYLDLLASPIPPTVAFAMKSLAALHKAKRLDGAAFVARAEPALYAKAKGAVKQALRLLAAFAKADATLAPEVCQTAAAALEHPESEVQEAALALIESFGDPADLALRAAIEDRGEVIAASLQGRVSQWLGSGDASPATAPPQPDEQNIDALRARARALPPDLAEAAGVDLALTELDSLSGAISAMPYDGLNAPRLSEESRIAPIDDLDALIANFVDALGKPEDTESQERILDGLTCLCDEQPDDFGERTAPLARRIEKLRKRLADSPWSVSHQHRHLMLLAHAWLNGDRVEFTAGGGGGIPLNDGKTDNAEPFDVPTHGIDDTFYLRIAEATRLIAERITTSLFSIPTHHGGWIVPAELVSRSRAAQAAGIETGPTDRVLALLRLAPDGRAEALQEAEDIVGEWGAALRHALGGEESLGETASLWVAAARARAPLADDEAVTARFPGLGPGAGEVGRVGYTIRVTHSDSYTFHYFDTYSEPEPPEKFPSVPGGPLILMPTVLAHRTATFRWWSEGGIVKHAEPLAPNYTSSPWGRSLHPANPDVLFASTASDSATHSDHPRPSSEPPYDGYDVAMDPDTLLPQMGMDMLCVGLNARDVPEGQLATDLLIAAIEDGRVTGAPLGAAMIGLLFTGFTKPKRWAARLSEAARIGPLHAQTTRLALEHALTGDPGETPRDIHALMELLHELCVETGEAVTDPRTRDYLASIKGGGKAAKLAKTLLALQEGDPLPHRRAAAALALTGRVERAERWAARR